MILLEFIQLEFTPAPLCLASYQAVLKNKARCWIRRKNNKALHLHHHNTLHTIRRWCRNRQRLYQIDIRYSMCRLDNPDQLSHMYPEYLNRRQNNLDRRSNRSRMLCNCPKDLNINYRGIDRCPDSIHARSSLGEKAPSAMIKDPSA